MQSGCQSFKPVKEMEPASVATTLGVAFEAASQLSNVLKDKVHNVHNAPKELSATLAELQTLSLLIKQVMESYPTDRLAGKS